jgi:hypothetical protein
MGFILKGVGKEGNEAAEGIILFGIKQIHGSLFQPINPTADVDYQARV